MATDTDRLRDWMNANGYDNKGLSHALGYHGDNVTNVLNGKVAVSHSFKCTFGQTFGRAALDVVFQFHPVPQCLTAFGSYQEHGKAHAAVGTEIRKGRMPHPKTLRCLGCNGQAQLYHHESYRPEDHLRVVPLCRKCHRQHHSGKKPLTFGVVPTAIGLIRIAIAGLQGTPMATPTLCPSQLNELGKGIFSPQDEAELMADGYIFACHVPGTLVGTLLVCKRPIADAVTDGQLDRRSTRVPIR